MSTVAEMFSAGTNYSMNSSSNRSRSTVEVQPPMIDQDHDLSEASGCSTADPETLTNLSDDDNTSCSNSEMGCDSINTTATRSPNNNNSHHQRGSAAAVGRNHCSNNNNNNHHNNNHIILHNDISSKNGSKSENNSISSSASSPSAGSSSRKNKRKNFKPRNIVEYAGSEEEGVSETATAVHRGAIAKRLRMQEQHHNEEVEQADDDEGDDDAFPLQQNKRFTDDSEPDDDAPLDLSDVQTDSKGPWKRTHFLNDALSPKRGHNKQSELSSSYSHSQASSSHPQSLHHNAHYHSHPLSHFTPVDLRLGLAPNHNTNDFAESAMKELLGLYGISEHLRQGDSDNTPMKDAPYANSNGQQPSSKIGSVPENMAKFLAAVHQNVQAAASMNSSDIGGYVGHDNNNIVKAPMSRNEHANKKKATSSAKHLSSRSLICDSETDDHEQSFEDEEITKNYFRSRSQRLPDVKTNGESLLLNRTNNHHAQNKSSKSRSAAGKSSGRGLTAFPVIREGLLGKGSGPVDYTRYVKRYANCIDCGYQQCRDLNYKEHFHCLDCSEGARVFVKKEEMIRHFKWHKKRDESLQHGFMRYSPSDDCGDRFSACPHNRKQTHYHCLQDGCEKVYISTSDVQMHANYHRKDSAIIQEGFQRFRAAEDCGNEQCAFRNQHTTHFHCRRDECSYTFKNKADMEKHKSYHIKDEQLNRDGFKKFMKHEVCNFATCRFSRVCNHIHCIREGCNYVLHSSGQLYSHKRKHERRDAELAYRKFKLAQTVMRGTISSDLANPCWNASLALGRAENNNENSDSSQDGDGENSHGDSEDIFKKFMLKCNCDTLRGEHYHCRIENCLNEAFPNTEAANEHSQNHELEDRISSLAYFTVDPANFDAQDSTIPCVSAKCTFQDKEKHYHCLWDDCSEIILATDEPFKRLEHFRIHEKTQKLGITSERDDHDRTSPDDGFFKKKRGRPPKNRSIEVPSGAPDAVFTSFKLPKARIPGLNYDHNIATDMKDPIGFISYPGKASCPDASCPFHSASCSHYHCAHPRCHFSVKDVHKLSLHLRDFHSNVDILDGYAYFDRNSNCRELKCEYNCNANHFHCLRDGYIFQRYSSMSSHESDCHESKSNSASSDDEEIAGNDKVVKSSGIFFPQSTQTTLNNGEISNTPVDLSSGLTNGDHYIETKSITDHSLSRILQLPESSETQFGPDSACGRPFCKLKRKSHYHCHLCNQAFSEIEKLRPHVVKHSGLSNNMKPVTSADSDPDSEGSTRLKNASTFQNETMKSKLKNGNDVRSNHSPVIPSQLEISPVPPFTPTSLANFMGYPGVPNPYLFLQQNPFTSLYAGMMLPHGYPSPLSLSHSEMMCMPQVNPSSLLLAADNQPAASPSPLANMVPSSPSSARSATPLKRPPSNASSPASPPSESKKQRMQLRILKDEPVPEGYLRFRFNEDCAYPHCGYREHQTHFHCTREDCGYSFCDKTRFVQHTARHERLDTLMGGDFKQYRANVACGREDCAYLPAANGSSSQALQNKASHFHCSKCEFVCTDTNKVVAHRRQHQKLDSIMAAGFEKFTPSQECNIDGCVHVQKQTHYHCLKCNYAVLGLSQMSAHKYRHAD